MYLFRISICHSGVESFKIYTKYLLKEIDENNFVLYFSHYLRKEGEGNVLFNDALNTFYLRLYSVAHMVMDDSDK